MSTGTRRATLDDLMKVEGKAELIAGRIVHMSPTGYWPGLVAGRIFRLLDDYAKQHGGGVALPDGVGFAIDELPSGRESFSPDAAFFAGTVPTDRMDFIEEAPSFAAEVRSKGDYGPVAERDLAETRADYFAAGTVVVWDVDTVHELIRCYRADDPTTAVECRRGDTADAEPALPGWRVVVDELFA